MKDAHTLLKNALVAARGDAYWNVALVDREGQVISDRRRVVCLTDPERPNHHHIVTESLAQQIVFNHPGRPIAFAVCLNEMQIYVEKIHVTDEIDELVLSWHAGLVLCINGDCKQKQQKEHA